jgi:hypothetical protein
MAKFTDSRSGLDLPYCRHRGQGVPGGFICNSNRLVHSLGYAQTKLCVDCLYCDMPNAVLPEQPEEPYKRAWWDRPGTLVYYLGRMVFAERILKVLGISCKCQYRRQIWDAVGWHGLLVKFRANRKLFR